MHIRPHLLAYKGQHIVRYRRDLMKISYSSRWSSMGFFLINYTVLILTSWYTHVYIYNISYLKRDFKLVGLQGTKGHKLVNYWANWLHSLNFNSHFYYHVFFMSLTSISLPIDLLIIYYYADNYRLVSGLISLIFFHTIFLHFDV